jgi:hypothetical protein
LSTVNVPSTTRVKGNRIVHQSGAINPAARAERFFPAHGREGGVDAISAISPLDPAFLADVRAVRLDCRQLLRVVSAGSSRIRPQYCVEIGGGALKLTVVKAHVSSRCH